MEDREIDRLTHAYLDGTISDSDGARLTELLRASEADLDRFIVLVDQHSSLWAMMTQAPSVREAMQAGLADAASFRPAGEWTGAAEGIRRRSFRGKWLVPLAAAAVLVVAAGVIWFGGLRGTLETTGQASLAPYEVVKQVGTVDVADGRLSTGTNSYCLVRYRDGSLLAMNQRSQVGLSEDSATGAKRVTVESGTIYVDAVAQKPALTVDDQSILYEVQGTRFAVGRGSRHVLVVLAGMVKASRRGAGVYVAGGQVAVAPLESADQPGSLDFVVSTNMPSPGSLAWLESVGIREEPIFAEMQAAAVPPRDNGGIDLGRFEVYGGTWKVDRASGAIRQEDASGPDCRLHFRQRSWRSGVVSCRFKVIERTGDAISVNVEFIQPNGSDGFGASKALTVMHQDWEWWIMEIQFDVGQDGILRTHLSYWPEKDLSGRLTYDFERGAHNSSNKRKREACAIGLCTKGGSVEFRDLQVRPIPARAAGEALPLAAYSFDEGKGSTVRDVSGGGAPMDLTIQKPEEVRWADGHLVVNGNAMITSGTANKLTDAWRRTGSLSLTFWGKADVEKTLGQQYSFLDLNFPKAGFHCQLTPDRTPGAEVVRNFVFNWVRKGPGVQLTVYANGETQAINDFPGPLGDWFASGPLTLQIPGAGIPGGTAAAVRPWTGEYHEIRIYDRALTPVEIRSHFEADRKRIEAQEAVRAAAPTPANP